MKRTIRLAGVATLAAAALLPTATASADMQDHGFYVGLGICWYGDTRPDDYFGINVRCPLQPMPGDSTYEPPPGG
jgi:hypothetical protein